MRRYANPTTSNTARRRYAGLFPLVLAILLTACSDNVTGIETGDKRIDDAPQFKTVYSLSVTTHDIWVNGSCDKVLGQATQGEFQYRVVFSGDGDVHSTESQNYDKRTGVVTGRVAGQKIDFNDETYSWGGLSSDAEISVSLSGTEWDGVIRDGRMSNRTGTKVVPFKLGSSARTITIGATKECQISLYYDAEWRAIEVPV